MYKKTLLTLFMMLWCLLGAMAQRVTVAGRIVDDDSQRPVEFATVLMKGNGYWAVTGADGTFRIKDVPVGKTMLIFQCLGYATRQLTIDISRDIPNLRIRLKQESLKLDEVTITAKRKNDEATTSYTIDRTALDQQQLLNIGDVATLLPGGKSVNATLMNDSRMALRSSSQEQGNASFGTAVEVDGMRLDNNAEPGETTGASTRTVSASDIESIEIVTGIPSVEYGDLSNGIVKVNTRKGKSPYIVEGKLNQHTRQIALNKGFDLGKNLGVLNASAEHARSFSDAASPYTAYQRNIVSLHYMNIFMRESMPLTLNAGLAGNIGGYNTEADPDQDLDNYTKVKDHTLRANMELHWLLNKSWITNLSLRATYSTSNHSTEEYKNDNSATTLAYKHSTAAGYYMAQDYDSNPNAPVVLGPTGYWHVKRFRDSKPANWSVRLKGDWAHRFGKVMSRLMVGAEYTGSRNNGRGTYYDDMRYAPTWREYRYDELPTLHNVALYGEEKVSVQTTKLSTLEVTAGLRDDMTLISGSDYGTVASVSPRVNSRYIFWQNRRKRWVSDLSIHAGWGKSVKLPSFQVLYPAPTYFDIDVFKTPSTADNTTITAIYSRPQQAVYNPGLKWQYTNQTDIGIDLNIKGTHIALSAFHHRTYNPYMSEQVYSPISYLYTPPEALNGLNIAAADRSYTVGTDGYITVHDATGAQSDVTLTSYDKNGKTYAITPTKTYVGNTRYMNGSPTDRYGLEWTVDFKQIKALNTSIRFDGNYYYYKGVNDVLFAYVPNATMTGASNEPYRYVGWYRGSSATSSIAAASISNGALQKALNLNTTVTTHLPKLRLIIALRIEASLYGYRRALSEYDGGTRGIILNSNSDYTGTPYDGSSENCYIAVYPEYYSTWDNPDEKIPFAERFLWAKDNDATLYNDLCKLVERTNYPYTMNPNRISSYYSANLSVTKEIGDHVSVSFYANNFFNNMKTVHSSQTNLDTSLFGSSYIPSYYYGLSLRLKL